MRTTEDRREVFERGGLMSLYLPKHNGHCCFVGLAEGGYVVVNSWIGPVVEHVADADVEWYLGEYASDNHGVSNGGHWVFQ